MFSMTAFQGEIAVVLCDAVNRQQQDPSGSVYRFPVNIAPFSFREIYRKEAYIYERNFKTKLWFVN